MDRLNKTGRVLMEYRIEFQKHYSDSIDDALKEAISAMYNEKKIDDRIFRNIFNDSISDEDFERILLKTKDFTKSNSELNYEFDQIRKKINEYMISIGFVDSMHTKNSIDMNKIIISRQFDLNRSYLMASFGVNQSEIVPLMKRRGFIEKFAVLRLNQVLKEIYNELRVPEDVDHGYSLVYYNKLTKGFSIDYKYYININLAINEEKMKTLVNKIRDLDKIVDKKFKNKLGSNYFINTKNDKGLEFNNREKPTSKQVVIDSPQKIVEQTRNNQAMKKEEPKKFDTPSQANNPIDALLIKQQKETQENNKNKPNLGQNNTQKETNNINTQPEQKKREIHGNIPIKQPLTEQAKEKVNEKPASQPDIVLEIKEAKKQEVEKKQEPVIEEFDIEFDISDKDLL